MNEKRIRTSAPKKHAQLGEDLLRAVIENPDEDEPRLVYADWLLESDDPVDRARGEFIQLDCKGSPSAAKLLEKHRKAWVAPYEGSRIELTIGERTWARRYPKTWTFRRGFVDEVGMHISDFSTEGKTLLGREPVRSLHLVGVGRYGGFPDLPELARLRELDLSSNRLYPEAAKALAGCPRLGALRVLVLDRCGIGLKAATELAAGTFSALRELDISWNALKDSGAIALAKAPWLAQLETLTANANDLTDKGREALRRATAKTARLSL